jgi:hypothetical protein
VTIGSDRTRDTLPFVIAVVTVGAIEARLGLLQPRRCSLATAANMRLEWHVELAGEAVGTVGPVLFKVVHGTGRSGGARRATGQAVRVVLACYAMCSTRTQCACIFRALDNGNNSNNNSNNNNNKSVDQLIHLSLSLAHWCFVTYRSTCNRTGN